MTTLAIGRWDWTEHEGPSRLMRELTDHGIARIRMPEAMTASADPRRFFERLFAPARSLLRSSRLVVKPRPKEITIVGSDAEGPPHIDDDEFFPAHVQVLLCAKAAKTGGESFYVDSWMVLNEIAVRDPELFDLLFTEPRAFCYSSATPVRATISLRYGNLICSHPPEPDDDLGRRFQPWVDNAPRYEFLAEPGDICVVNHQRMLHGRRAFEGSREFVRLLYWLNHPFEPPAQFAERALRFARRFTEAIPDGPLWAREWLVPNEASTAGVERLAAVLAYVAGEDYEKVANQHGITPNQLFHWTSRVLAVSSASLGDDDSNFARSREVVEELSLSAVETLFRKTLAEAQANSEADSDLSRSP